MNIEKLEIHKEIDSRDERIIQSVILDSGIKLYVSQKGTAFGTDGKHYYPVLSEDPISGDVLIIGWSDKIDREYII